MKHLHTLAALACLSATAWAANPIIEIKTSKGTIKAELFEDKASKTVKNFLQYVKDKHYDGTIFHRVISDFMIQGGGFTKGFGGITNVEEYKAKEKKTGKPIENEADNGEKNVRGTLAMARTGDPHSATAQFFINVKDNAFLDHKEKTRAGWGYAVFGKVIEGMDVVDEIKKAKTKTIAELRMGDVPVDEITIESVKLVSDKPSAKDKDAKKDDKKDGKKDK
ncbi:MAG: peptidylprolyl isomerase [Gemmataceae bacterium]|nr:peptidylprolyl isomerase [Gemmataceae bacterium]